MPDIDDIMRFLNGALTIAFAVIGLCVLLVMSRPRSARARADRFSLRIRLPYGTERTREEVARGMRLRTIATGVAILAGALLSAFLLFTPVATSSLFVFYALVTPLIVGAIVGTTVVSVRERLFHPTPDAPRVARMRTMHVSDYLDPVRRGIPWALAAAAMAVLALVGITALRDPLRVDPIAGGAAAVFGVVTIVAVIALPWLERLVLAQPQPASDSLELAWDDALRAGTISSLRLSSALAAWFALSLSIAALWLASGSTWSGFAYQLPTWGMIALQLTYPNTGKPLPAPLYPEWLRRPVAAGGSL